MPSASTIRRQIENALADRIPSALTPSLRPPLPVAETGISYIDQHLHGGFPVGAITELVGPECSGRTSLAFAFLAQRTQNGMSSAWIDISGSFHPESAAASGIELNRLLWVRCRMNSPGDTAPPNPAHKPLNLEQYKIPSVTLKGLHGGGCGSHPRTEIKDLPPAINNFLQPKIGAKHPPDNDPRVSGPELLPTPGNISSQSHRPGLLTPHPGLNNSPMACLDRALRVADLLLQAGGFTSIVLDAGSLLPEHISRVPLSTWFRYRTASERTQTSVLLLTQHPSSKSSAELVLNLLPGKEILQERTLFTGMQYVLSVTRGNNCPDHTRLVTMKSPRPSEGFAHWKSYAPWGNSYEALS
jgi:recombination protein RecA